MLNEPVFKHLALTTSHMGKYIFGAVFRYKFFFFFQCNTNLRMVFVHNLGIEKSFEKSLNTY